jgi:hypothetical protein
MKKLFGCCKRLRLKSFCLFSVFNILASCLNAHQLTIQSEEFFLDGQKFKMCGIRVASGTCINTSITIDGRTPFSHLLEQLDTFNMYGVNTLTVFYTGSGGNKYNSFSPDGKSFTSL